MVCEPRHLVGNHLAFNTWRRLKNGSRPMLDIHSCYLKTICVDITKAACSDYRSNRSSAKLNCNPPQPWHGHVTNHWRVCGYHHQSDMPNFLATVFIPNCSGQNIRISQPTTQGEKAVDNRTPVHNWDEVDVGTRVGVVGKRVFNALAIVPNSTNRRPMRATATVPVPVVDKPVS